MSKYETIKLHHANLNKEVTLYVNNLCFWHWSDKSEATHVYFAGQVIFPAKEKPDEITAKLKELSNE